MLRFVSSVGESWTGNFQGGSIGRIDVLEWPEANSLAVLVGDAFYLIDSTRPDVYVTLGEESSVSAVLLTGDRARLVVGDGRCLFGFGTDRHVVWSRDDLGGYVLDLAPEGDDILRAEIEIEMGERTRVVRIFAENGHSVRRFDWRRVLRPRASKNCG